MSKGHDTIKNINENKKYLGFIVFMIFTTVTNWVLLPQEFAVLVLAISGFAFIEVTLGIPRTKTTEAVTGALTLVKDNITRLKSVYPDKPMGIIDTIENLLVFLVHKWDQLNHVVGEGDTPQNGDD